MQVWPHQRFGAMSRGSVVGLRLVIVAVLIVSAVWASLRAYAEYKAHRATSLLAEASRVQVGEAEPSVLPLVERYGGYKWTPEPLPPREQWTDLRQYDYQKDLQSDYKYEIEISPFGTTALHPGRLTQVMRAARKAVPAHLRTILGMRNWGTVVDFSIRNGRVQSVLAMVLFEGRSEWLGHEWMFANAMPRYEIQPRAFAIGSTILEMENGGGTAIENYFTTRASEQEVRLARKFNAECLTSIRGCDGLCDVAPRALEYLKQHPDAAWGIIPPKCH